MILRKEIKSCPQGVVVVMSDTAILAAMAKTTLTEIAKQANALGVGLQNAAPGDKAAAPNNSVQYLLDVASCLTKKIEELDVI
jgi:hypothetical protein